MQVKKLIELLQAVPEDEQDYEVMFEDRKFGLHALSDQFRVRAQPRIISLLDRDDPPKFTGVETIKNLPLGGFRTKENHGKGQERRDPEASEPAQGGEGREDLSEGLRGEDHGEGEVDGQEQRFWKQG